MFRNMIEGLDDTGQIKELNKSWKLWTDIESAALKQNASLQGKSELMSSLSGADITRPVSLLKGVGNLTQRILPKKLQGARGLINVSDKLSGIEAKSGVSKLGQIASKLMSGTSSGSNTENAASNPTAIVQLIKSKGVTNPVQVMQILNYDQSGRKINSFTEKEVVDMLKGKDPYQIIEDSPMPGAEAEGQ